VSISADLPCYRRNQNAVNIWAAGCASRIQPQGKVMALSRVLPLAVALVLLAFGPAKAQFGGMPGMPGSPGMPGMPGTPGMPGGAPEGQGLSGFSAPQQPPPACQQLIAYRDETAKHGQALQAAGKKKPPPDEACKLFKAFIGAEAKFLRALEQNSATCGVPAEVINQVKLGHNKASETAKHVCDAAAQGPRPAGPSLSDALGATPTVPDSRGARGQGTFDTLVGSPLAR
jgi:hypothetical protein